MFLCADLDAFFVSVEQALNPALLAKPVIVGGSPEERGVVASASYEAREFGIHSGMSTARAHRLCPNAIFLRGNFEQYRWFSRKFYKILSSFSPDINMASIDEAYVNIKGTKRLFGPQLALAKRLKNKIKNELNIPVSIGIARTKIFSKIACDRSKPDGLLVVQPDQEMEFLSPLAVNVLPGIGPKHLSILKNLNINTVAELLATPDWALGIALGNYAKVLKFFISGGDFSSCDRMKSISREITLTKDTFDKNLIYALFYYLTERACATLRGKKLLANIMIVKIRFSDFKTVSKRTKIPLSNAQQLIFEYGTRTIEDILKEKKRVRLVGVALSKFQYDGLQPSMFEIKQRRLNQLNFALDRVRDKFGFNSLYPANTGIIRDKELK